MGLSKYCSYLAVLLFVAFILMMSALLWGVPDKTGEVDHDQNDNDDQKDATAADMVRIHLKTFSVLIEKF